MYYIPPAHRLLFRRPLCPIIETNLYQVGLNETLDRSCLQKIPMYVFIIVSLHFIQTQRVVYTATSKNANNGILSTLYYVSIMPRSWENQCLRSLTVFWKQIEEREYLFTLASMQYSSKVFFKYLTKAAKKKYIGAL